MPFLTPDVTDERDGLATFVEHQIQQLASTLHNLDREQLAATPTASSLSLGALMRHCVFVAERFAEAIRVAPDCPEAPQRSADQAAAEEGLETRALRAEDTPRILLAELERVGAEIAAAIRQSDPDTNVPVPQAPWFSGAEQWSVRWCALHMIEEFARHAGHADMLRQSLDGKGAYELNALADGEPWPPEGW